MQTKLLHMACNITLFSLLVCNALQPLFRSQKEEVEVISRRFLQRGHWDDKALKSDVRVQLRSYVLEVLDRWVDHLMC